MSTLTNHAIRRASGIILFSLLLVGCNEDVVREYYDSGEIHKELTVKNGLAEGTLKVYYRNGGLESEANMEKGRLNGEKRVYFESGTVHWTAEYIDDKIDGMYREFSESGSIVTEAEFANGVQHGVTTTYRPDGKVEVIESYRDGLMHGLVKTFHPNGTLRLFAILDNGNSMFYEKYDSLGVVTDRYRAHVLTIAQDTLRVGDEFLAEIKIHGPLENGDRIEVCLFKNPSPTFAVFKTCMIDADGRASYSQVVQETGEYMFLLKDYDNQSSPVPFKSQKVVVIS